MRRSSTTSRRTAVLLSRAGDTAGAALAYSGRSRSATTPSNGQSFAGAAGRGHEPVMPKPLKEAEPAVPLVPVSPLFVPVPVVTPLTVRVPSPPL